MSAFETVEDTSLDFLSDAITETVLATAACALATERAKPDELKLMATRARQFGNPTAYALIYVLNCTGIPTKDVWAMVAGILKEAGYRVEGRAFDAHAKEWARTRSKKHDHLTPAQLVEIEDDMLGQLVNAVAHAIEGGRGQK